MKSLQLVARETAPGGKMMRSLCSRVEEIERTMVKASAIVLDLKVEPMYDFVSHRKWGEAQL